MAKTKVKNFKKNGLSETEPGKYKVLVAENDKFISRAFTEGLKKIDFTVITAYNGEEALAKIKKEKPDIILLDLVLLIKNGFEVLAEIKESKKFKSIPVIVLSNLEEDNDILRAKKLGATEYLVKANFSMSQIIDKIRQYI